jgi:transposase
MAGTPSCEPSSTSVLLTDGYAAYLRYAEKIGITHAQCWSQSRRSFFEALDAEPEGATSALEQIKAMYALEENIATKNLGPSQAHPAPDVFKALGRVFL